MGLIKLMREGWWSVRSESDPRWNGEGRSLVGMFSCPPDAQRHIDRTKELLGEEPPEDLTWQYMKD